MRRLLRIGAAILTVGGLLTLGFGFKHYLDSVKDAEVAAKDEVRQVAAIEAERDRLWMEIDQQASQRQNESLRSIEEKIDNLRGEIQRLRGFEEGAHHR